MWTLYHLMAKWNVITEFGWHILSSRSDPFYFPNIICSNCSGSIIAPVLYVSILPECFRSIKPIQLVSSTNPEIRYSTRLVNPIILLYWVYNYIRLVCQEMTQLDYCTTTILVRLLQYMPFIWGVKNNNIL